MRLLAALLLVGAVPLSHAGTACTEERYVAGTHTFPTHDEAMAQCQQDEAVMTHAETGAYERVSGCHDEGDTGTHGEWRTGRVAMDVVARESGEPYTFEGLWLCKPEVD